MSSSHFSAAVGKYSQVQASVSSFVGRPYRLHLLHLENAGWDCIHRPSYTWSHVLSWRNNSADIRGMPIKKRAREGSRSVSREGIRTWET